MIRPHDHPAAMRHQKTYEADQSRLRHQTSHQERIHHQVKTPKREELPPQRDSSFLPFQHQIQDPCLCREKMMKASTMARAESVGRSFAKETDPISQYSVTSIPVALDPIYTSTLVIPPQTAASAAPKIRR